MYKNIYQFFVYTNSTTRWPQPPQQQKMGSKLLMKYKTTWNIYFLGTKSLWGLFRTSLVVARIYAVLGTRKIKTAYIPFSFTKYQHKINTQPILINKYALLQIMAGFFAWVRPSYSYFTLKNQGVFPLFHLKFLWVSKQDAAFNGGCNLMVYYI